MNIYITPAGITAAKNVKKYFDEAVKQFGPFEGIVVLSSKDVEQDLIEGFKEADYPFSVELITIDNPYSDISDYYEILSKLIEATSRMIVMAGGDWRGSCIVNSSGGTTKFTMWMFDFANILNYMVPTKSFFATYNPEKEVVKFTERPLLSEKLIKEMLNINLKDERKKL
jgi:hypothetical protein